MSKDKIEVNMNIYDIPIVVEQLEKANKETERLNNIINELEKELDKEYNTYITNNVIYGKTFKAGANVFREHIKYKLQELKGSDKE